MKNKPLLGILCVLALGLFGCAALKEKFITQQTVPIVSELPDGSLLTNNVPVDALSPEVLAAARTATGYIPSPWGEMAFGLITLGAASYFGYNRWRAKRTLSSGAAVPTSGTAPRPPPS